MGNHGKGLIVFKALNLENGVSAFARLFRRRKPMVKSARELWERYKKYSLKIDKLGFCLDVSRMSFEEDFLTSMGKPIEHALSAMEALEKGGVANSDENRMVGHYWLRNPSLAPNGEIRALIETTLRDIHEFVAKVHSGSIRAQKGSSFSHILIVGIGGSALGPQFVDHALRKAETTMSVSFVDNTDPDGVKRALDLIGDLSSTLTIVISKSGGTKETRNGMLIVKQAYTEQQLSFATHSVAVTGIDSELDKLAVSEKWVARFPMWDWIGGRTSETSAVGLLPAALCGYKIDT